MNERVIDSLLRTLLDGCNDIPRSDWPRHEAEEIAVSRCTLEEALAQIWDHPWTPASETIEQFASRMEEYEATAVTEDQSRIFSIATETAWELYEMVKELEK